MTSEEFSKLFKKKDDEEFMLWGDGDAIGLTILKKYPHDTDFIIAKNQKGEDDTVALIKLWYRKSEIKNNKVHLYLTISKASRYLLNSVNSNHWDFNPDDKNSPLPKDVKRSRASKEPVDLEEGKYFFKIDDETILDTDKNEVINPDLVIEEIFKEHINTIDYGIMKSIISFKDLLMRRDFPVTLLKKINENLFGREIKLNEFDFYRGITKPYKKEDISVLPSINKVSFFGTEIPITNQTIITSSILLVMVFILNRFFNFEFFLNIENNLFFIEKSTIYLVSMTIVFLLIMDRIMPLILFKFINISINIRYKFVSWKLNTKIFKRIEKFRKIFIEILKAFMIGIFLYIILKLLLMAV